MDLDEQEAMLNFDRQEDIDFQEFLFQEQAFFLHWYIRFLDAFYVVIELFC